MTAQIIQFSDYTKSNCLPEHSTKFHFWTGLSGKRYVHTVYDASNCPDIGLSVYIIVKRSRSKIIPIFIGIGTKKLDLINLMKMKSGNEIHLHLLCNNVNEAIQAAEDLKRNYEDGSL